MLMFKAFLIDSSPKCPQPAELLQHVLLVKLVSNGSHDPDYKPGYAATSPISGVGRFVLFGSFGHYPDIEEKVRSLGFDIVLLDSDRKNNEPLMATIIRQVLELFPRQPAVNTALDKLTPREQDVLNSLAAGNSYKMVAHELGISIDTVRTHIKRIYEKLHVHSVAEAIAKAFLTKG